MIEIEFSDPFRSVCDCCGGTTTALTRFVRKDGNAYAVYYAYFTENHPERHMIGLVALGTWGIDDKPIPADRVAFGFEMWSEVEKYRVDIVDAENTPWGNAPIIGQPLTAAEAHNHPWLDDVFDLTDRIADEDPNVREFFGQEVGGLE